MTVQHPRLRIAQIEPFSRAGNGDIHQSTLFLETTVFPGTVFMREKPFFQTGNENGVEFQPLGRVNRHQLERILPFLRLIFSRFQ